MPISAKSERLKKIDVSLVELQFNLEEIEKEIIEKERAKLDISRTAMKEAKQNPEKGAEIVDTARKQIFAIEEEIREKEEEAKSLKSLINKKKQERANLLAA